MVGMCSNAYMLYYEIMAGLGGAFENIAELKVPKYNEAMSSDKRGWSNTVEEDYERMVSNKVWIPRN